MSAHAFMPDPRLGRLTALLEAGALDEDAFDRAVLNLVEPLYTVATPPAEIGARQLAVATGIAAVGLAVGWASAHMAGMHGGGVVGASIGFLIDLCLSDPADSAL